MATKILVNIDCGFGPYAETCQGCRLLRIQPTEEIAYLCRVFNESLRWDFGRRVVLRCDSCLKAEIK